jgi:hypothetical protein
MDSSHAALLMRGQRIEGLMVHGLRVSGAAGPLLELRTEGSATLSGVDATGVLDPAIVNMGGFLLNWKDSH